MKLLRVVLPLWAALFFMCSAAFAQGPMPPWDRSDPTNQAETKAFFERFWKMQATGIDDPTLDSFAFTHQTPEVMTTLLLPAIEVFNDLYASKLNYTGAGGSFYTLFDLMDDEPAIAARFQYYALTGRIETAPTDDNDLIAAHLNMAIEAITQGDFYKLDALNVENDGTFETTNLIKVAGGGSPWVDPLPPIVVPPALKQFDCDLREWVKRSLLACMASKGLYLRDGKKTGRFDCDDFTDALAKWLEETLKKQYPNLKLYSFNFWWQCPKLDSSGNPVIGPDGNPVYEDVPGHTILLIEIDGQYYLIEPQTGNIVGPFSNYDEAYRRAMEMNAPPCPNWRPSPTAPIPYDPHKRLPGEPKPWWEYEDMQKRFCEALKKCCKELGTWPAPATGCSPTTLPDGTTPGTIGCGSQKPYNPGWISPNACP